MSSDSSNHRLIGEPQTETTTHATDSLKFCTLSKMSCSRGPMALRPKSSCVSQLSNRNFSLGMRSSRTRTAPSRRVNELGISRAATYAATIASKLETPTSGRSYTTTAPSNEVIVHRDVQELRQGHKFATLTISNPRKLNIVSTPLLRQLVEKCKEISADKSLRAVVLTGGETSPGKAPAFIGGADINEMYRLSSADEARQFITNVHLACKAIRDIPVPVIARVDGYALGAGLEIMASCDLRMATKSSTFAMPEVKVGIPSVVEAALLPGLIGMGRTRRLLYLAENIKADQAETWGLVDCVVPDISALDTTVQEWVDRLCEAAPNAIRKQKELMQSWEDTSASEGIAAGIDSFANAYEDGGVEPKQYMGEFSGGKRST